MISRVESANDDIGINSMNNLLKNITDIQSAFTEKLMEVSITEQIESSQSGIGDLVDVYA
jgi:hypothetical protein